MPAQTTAAQVQQHMLCATQLLARMRGAGLGEPGSTSSSWHVVPATSCHALQSLARMGAHVTGIDVAAASVAIAERHAQDDPWIASRVTYREASAEQLVDEGAGQSLGFAMVLCCSAPHPAAWASLLQGMRCPAMGNAAV